MLLQFRRKLGLKVLYIRELNSFLEVNSDYIDNVLSEEELLRVVNNNENIIEKIKKYNSDIERENSRNNFTSYTLCIHPTTRCNLACKYCFLQSKNT